MSRSRWYLNRLGAMSPGEVGERARSRVLHRLDDIEYRSRRQRWDRRWNPSESRLLAPVTVPGPLGFLTAERARGFAEACPQDAAAVIEAAERSLNGRFQYFGYPEFALKPPIDYSRDPLNHRRWPDRHGKRIDYRNGEVGDPKLVWELNRCQHLPGMVQAWLLSGDEQFATHAIRLMREWIEQQVPGRGIAWSNGFEAGIRGISFAVCLDALRGSSILTPAVERQILVSLFQHGQWILRDRSTHSSANNHLVGELAGLATIALLAPELRVAASWGNYALPALAREADKQILSDGLGSEQAFTYTLFITDLVAVVVALLRAQGRPEPEQMLDAMARVGRGLWAQIGEADTAPTYGDTDDAFAVRLDAVQLRQPRGVAATIGAGTGDYTSRLAAVGRLDPTGWWLFGESARTPAGGLRHEVAGSAELPAGGLVILRASGLRTVVDVGSLGYLSIAAHGHADALQVTVSDRTGEMVVDPGVGSYFGRPHLRRAFRGTAFHPTVTVDSLDQSEQAGPFLWRRHARTWPTYINLEAGIVAAEHDGYSRLPDPVRHRRVVVEVPNGPIVVYDRLNSRGFHEFQTVWPFHPSLDVTVDGKNLLAEQNGEPRLVVMAACSHETEIWAIKGQEEPFVGWWSRQLEAVEPAWHCGWDAYGSGQVEFVTLLCPIASGAWPRVTCDLACSGGLTAIEFSVNERSWKISIDLDQEIPVSMSDSTQSTRASDDRGSSGPLRDNRRRSIR